MRLSVNPGSTICKALLLGLCTTGTSAADLPIVDLGYEIHQAISYDVSGENITSASSFD